MGTDPLTDDELRRAQDLALTRSLRAEGENVTGGNGPQSLVTDLAEQPPSEVGLAAPPRRAAVTFYDYKDDTYVIKTVNLTTGKVEGTDARRGIQPPPAPAEAREAVRLLLDSPLGDGVEKDYRDATGKALTGPEALTVSGFAYRGLQEGPAPADLRECGEHRCVRLFTKVKGGQWIDTRDFVIDLSERRVSRLS